MGIKISIYKIHFKRRNNMKLTKGDIDKVRHIEGFPIARD